MLGETLESRAPSAEPRISNTKRRAPSAERRSDIIMSAAGLNDILKRMTRLTQQAQSAPKPERTTALFEVGVEADGLANLMNREVEAHGMQERQLLDLALSRTKELGILIQYNKQKKSFFYDGSAFRQYLAEAPRGQHAAAAEFQLLSYQFYQSTSTDPQTLESAAAAKQRFLEKHPSFKGNPEMRLYLAIDYQDLYHLHRDAHDAARMERFYQRARTEFQRIVKLYPGTEQANAARQQLQKLDQERQQQRPHMY
jgi:TolA-binding protein